MKNFFIFLSELKNRDFSTDEIQSIEAELDSLNLESNPENRKKYFGKALYKLNDYLKNTFSLDSQLATIPLSGQLLE